MVAFLCATIGSVSAMERSHAVRLFFEVEGALETCPDEDQFKQAVAARLGFSPFHEKGAISMTVSIVVDGSGLAGHMVMLDGDGTPRGRRTLSSPAGDCQELVETMAVAVSVALEPFVEEAEPIPLEPISKEPESPVESEPIPMKPASSPAPVAPSRDELALDQPWRPRASVGLIATMGLTPKFVPGITGQLGVQRESLSLSVEGRVDLVSTMQVDEGEIRSSLLAVWLAPCWHGSPLLVCALGGVGSLRVEGEGVEAPKQDQALYSALGARVGVDLPLSVRVHGDVLAAITRTTFYLSDEPQWTSFPVHLGLGAAFGGMF